MKQRISIIDIDSKIPNLALKKIEKYHVGLGNEVVWNNDLMASVSEKIYVSCVFTKNRHLAEKYEGVAEIGGSGYSLETTLPPGIDSVLPHINLGFTTRGCIRQCPFCIVPKKEGSIRIEGDLLDLWDGKARDVVILDNNILALPEHFRLICEQAKENKIRLDFNQGLDHRLLSQDIVDLLKSISHIEYRFAFDNSAYEKSVLSAIQLLKKNKINRCSWYVLAGFDSSFEDAIDRLNLLRDNNQNAYLQRYESCNGDKRYVALARWANQRHLFQAMTFNQFLKHPDNERYVGILGNVDIISEA
jgi:hypothetical protein